MQNLVDEEQTDVVAAFSFRPDLVAVDEEMEDGHGQESSSAGKVDIGHERPEKRKHGHEQDKAVDKYSFPASVFPGNEAVGLKNEIREKMGEKNVREKVELEHGRYFNNGIWSVLVLLALEVDFEPLEEFTADTAGHVRI